MYFNVGPWEIRILTTAIESLRGSLQFDVKRLGAIIIRFWDAACPVNAINSRYFGIGLNLGVII